MKLTDEVRKDIIQRLSDGESLRAACRAHNVSAGSFIDALSRDGTLAEQYARAREVGVDSQAEEMHELEMAVLSGELDPNAFRAAMDARKWRLARQSPRKYGDRQTIEQKTTHAGAVTVKHELSPDALEILRDLGVCDGGESA